MNPSHDNPLDRLLDQWGQSHTVGKSELADLQRRIEARLTAEPLPLSHAPPQSLAPVPARRRWVAATLAAAAGLLVALGGWWWLAHSGVADQQLAHTPEQPAIPRGPAVAEQSRLLAEYQEVFGDDLAWLVEQSNRAEIGLRPANSLQAAPRAFVAVRLVLVARRPGSQEWQEVQTLDIVTQPERFIEVLPDARQGAAFSLWAYPLEGNMISIDLCYQPGDLAEHAAENSTENVAERITVPSSFSIETSSVESMGKSAPIYRFNRQGVEYQLYQSADLLTGHDIG